MPYITCSNQKIKYKGKRKNHNPVASSLKCGWSVIRVPANESIERGDLTGRYG